MSRSRVASVLLIMLGLAVASPVAAQQAGGTPTPPPPGSVNSWALAPTGTDPNEPSSRPNLSYEIAPGAKVDDSVTLWNYGDTQLNFRVYATDAFNNPTGGFDLLAGDKSPSDVGSWVSLPQANVTAPPHTKTDMPFTLTVPADARPGDHAAGIIASSQVQGKNDDGRIVTLDRRTGSRLYLRVAGPLEPGLLVENVQTTYHATANPLNGAVDVSYTVRNVGNIRLGTHQGVEVRNPFGKRMKANKLDDLTEILPGNAVTITTHFAHVTAALRVTTDIKLTPFQVGDAGSTGAPAVTRAAHTWAVPWVLVALSIVAGLGWQVRRRLRDRRWANALPVTLQPDGQSFT